MKIRAHLALMAIAILGPAILASAVTLTMVLNAERDAAEQRVQDAAKAVAVSIDRELFAAEATLKVWATSPYLDSGNLESMYQQALAARVSTDSIVLLYDETAQQLLNTHLPIGTPLPRRSHPEHITYALQAGKPVVTDLYVGATTKRPVIAVDVPIVTRKGRKLVATQAFPQEHFQSIFNQFNLPPDWIIGIFDRKGITIARSRRSDEFVGKPVHAELYEATTKSFSGTLRHPSREGIEIYDAFTHSELAGWVIAVGVPVEAIEAPARRAALVTALGIFLALAAAVAAAIIMANRISNSVSRAAHSAIALGQGRVPQRHHSGVDELDDLDAALGDAGALLQSEIHARGEAEAARAELFAKEQQARKDAEDQNRAKDQFLAMLGHELRNPLSAISGAASVLNVSKAGTPESEHARTVVARQSKHLGRIVDDLLDVSRVMSGKILLEREPTDLAEAVRRCVATLNAAGATVRHSLELDLQPAIVSADLTRLDQVISNVLVNALKYTPDGGRIDVSVRVTGEAPACWAQLIVSDSGIGIGAELLPNVFDVFVQGSASLDRSMGGLGLGLALVRRLVSLHGGTVTAHSEGENRGSTFIVLLPCATQTAASAGTPAQAVRIESRRILIVDDHDDGRSMMRIRLEAEGHRVIEAEDGPTGLRKALEEDIDVAIVDIGLPGMDGYELVRRLRVAPKGRDLLVIALTGYGQKEDKQLAEQAGFDVHLTKPVEHDVLHEALRAQRRSA